MSDTRCANPEYQLDVDVMILEHLLYHATRAQFKALKADYSQSNDAHVEEPMPASQQSEAERLLCAFDSFVNIFKTTHKDYDFTTGTKFNIMVLETIVLLKIGRQATSSNPVKDRSPISEPSVPNAMRQLWLSEQRSLLDDRMQWLRYRESARTARDLHSSVPQQDILDEVGISSWTSFQKTHVIPQRSELIAPIFSVLHRFMALSSNIAPMMGDINQNWMELALQLMLQAALELLSRDIKTESRCANDSEMNGDTYMPGLIECFAFGYLPNLTESKSASGTEVAISSMFASSKTTENPKWTRLRYEALSEFRILPDYQSSPLPSPDPAPYKQRTERLKHKYPYADIESNLLRCLEHFWILNCSENVSGKPVLIQIEEGSLAGFSNSEFEDFLVRVGLERDDKGILRLELT